MKQKPGANTLLDALNTDLRVTNEQAETGFLHGPTNLARPNQEGGR